jgi:hypothetical protein
MSDKEGRSATPAWLFLGAQLVVIALAVTDAPGSSSYARAHTYVLVMSAWGLIILIAVTGNLRERIGKVREVAAREGPTGVLHLLEIPVLLITLVSAIAILILVDLDWVGTTGVRVSTVGAVLTAHMLWSLRHRFLP